VILGMDQFENGYRSYAPLANLGIADGYDQYLVSEIRNSFGFAFNMMGIWKGYREYVSNIPVCILKQMVRTQILLKTYQIIVQSF
jgi:hypothetical protein